MKNEFLKELQWRGLINDCTDLEALDALMEEGNIKRAVQGEEIGTIITK